MPKRPTAHAVGVWAAALCLGADQPLGRTDAAQVLGLGGVARLVAHDRAKVCEQGTASARSVLRVE